MVENAATMGEYLLGALQELQEKHAIIGDARGLGLFAGVELVADRKTRAPADESTAIKVAAECLKRGVMIGRTNRSFPQDNNTLCLSPALICTRGDVDEIVAALDGALGEVVAK